MRILFMGTPKFASVILDSLFDWASKNGSEIAGVFTNEDAKSKRGNKLIESAVKEVALEHESPIFQVKTLRDEAVQSEIRKLSPDVICVAAYSKLLPKEVLEIPRHGCINVHASLLPSWRGAAPIERAILAGDEFAGVSIMKMEEGLDTGDFCNQRKTLIGDKTDDELTFELAKLGAASLSEVLSAFNSNVELNWEKQEDLLKGKEPTYANKIEKKEVLISDEDCAIVAKRKVQASSKSHPAKCLIDERQVTITKARVDQGLELQDFERSQNNVLWKDKKLHLLMKDGALEIMNLKPDGKKEMDAKSFVAGAKSVRENKAYWSAI